MPSFNTMQAFNLFAVLGAMAAAAIAQVTFNTTTGVFDCASANATYCGGDSLKTNIIIRCADFIGQPGNCNDNLAGIPPLGVKIFAPCYQSSATAGDAACSFNGIVYPDVGPSFPVPSNTNVTSSSSTSASTYKISSSKKTSPAKSSATNNTAQAKNPYAFGFTTDIGGVRIGVEATETFPAPKTAVTAVASQVSISGGIFSSSVTSVTAFEGTTAVSSLKSSFPSALAENLSILPGAIPVYRASINSSDSSDFSTDPPTSAVGAGQPSATSPPFDNSADLLRTYISAAMVGMMGLAIIFV